MWTMIASKIASDSVWSGTEIASSSALSAGYLARGIGRKSSAGGWLVAATPMCAAKGSGRSKMKARHCSHHAATESSGASA